jgi:hypothetical protein
VDTYITCMIVLYYDVTLIRSERRIDVTDFSHRVVKRFLNHFLCVNPMLSLFKNIMCGAVSLNSSGVCVFIFISKF